MKNSPRSPQLEKACAQQQRPNAAINKQTNKQINKCVCVSYLSKSEKPSTLKHTIILYTKKKHCH